MKRILFTILTTVLFAVPVSAVDKKELTEGLYIEMKTNKGTILLKLYYKRTPNTVANFVGLAEGSKAWKDPITGASRNSKFYDGLSFHRVIADFMIQGGDPLGTGKGGPGFRFADEFHAELRHDKAGVLSMANSGPNTNGSQFFITHKATPWLDDKHSVFGQVVAGLDVVNNIQQEDTIEQILVVRKGKEAEEFDVALMVEQALEVEKKKSEKNRKIVPRATGKIDPSRVPGEQQAAAEEVSVEFMVIAYKGVRSANPEIYYEKKGALTVAEQITDLARREGVDFSTLIEQFSDFPQQTRIPNVRDDPGVPAFLKTALTLKVGQISDPIDSPFGYLILKRVELQFVEARHILISFQGAERSQQTRGKDEAREIAKTLLHQLQQGEDFAELAKAHSDGPSGPKGGDLGRFSRGAMVPAFDKVVFALNPGEISEIVETPFGFHLIKREK